MQKIFNALRGANATPPATYRDSCIAACNTAQGATALAAELRRKHAGTAPELMHVRQLLSKQAEAAEHAARHRVLEHEIYVRIPAVQKRDEEAALAMLKSAEKDEQAAKQLVAIAKERADGFTSRAASKRQSCEEAAGAAARNLNGAEAALQGARDKEDAPAMARAAEIVVQARKGVLATHDRNSAALLEATTYGELADKAGQERAIAQARLDEAAGRRHQATLALMAVKADSAALEAFLAHVRWHEVNRASAHPVWPPYVDHASFYFHKSERAVRWDGQPGARVIDVNAMGGLGGIFNGLKKPDWAEFDQDPSELVSDEICDQVN